MAKREERIASVIMTGFSAVYTAGAFLMIPKSPLKQQVGPGVFPRVTGLLMLGISLIYLIQQWRGYQKEADETRAAIIGAEEKVETKADLKTMGIMILIMFAYAFLFETLGYPIATFLSFMAGALVLNRKHLVRDAIIAFIGSFGFYFLFGLVLRVQLPSGLLALIGL